MIIKCGREERDTLQESSILLSNNTVDVTNTWRALTAELMETAEVWAKLWEAALITYSERNNSRAAVCSYHFQRGTTPQLRFTNRSLVGSSLNPEPIPESRTHRWAPETDLQWGPRHLDIHRGKTPGTSGALTIWLCCSWNKLLVRLAGGELPPDWAWFLPRFFSVLSPMEFSFLAAVASGLLSWGHFISSDITDLIAQILFKLNWAGQWHH